MKSKYKVTLKFWDKNDRVCYLRLPANTPFFVMTGHGSVNEKHIDILYDTLQKADLPDDALPVFQMPTTSK